MASARNEAPRGIWGGGVPLPTGEGSEKVAMPLTRKSNTWFLGPTRVFIQNGIVVVMSLHVSVCLSVFVYVSVYLSVCVRL